MKLKYLQIQERSNYLVGNAHVYTIKFSKYSKSLNKICLSKVDENGRHM